MTDETIVDRFPEISAEARCEQYGHVLTGHDLLGDCCMRCGRFDAAWAQQADGGWR